MMFKRRASAQPSELMDDLIRALSMVESLDAPACESHGEARGAALSANEAQSQFGCRAAQDSEPLHSRSIKSRPPADEVDVPAELAESPYELSNELSGESAVIVMSARRRASAR